MPTSTTLDVALDHYNDRQSLVNATGQVAGQMWSEVDPNRIADTWVNQLPELSAVVSGAQLGAARAADPYITAALDSEDIASEAVSPIDPGGFSGEASDGRGLIGLLTNPIVVTLLAIQDGIDVARALGMGRANLDMMVRTQVADAGRAADQVSLTARPRATGYVRIAVGNSCARCLLLAGKEYRWSTGFKRHPRCDCIHVPIGIAKAGFGRSTWRAQDPRRIYDRMTVAERIRSGISKADQRAIAMGADLDQVVNAQRGVYTAGGREFTREGATRRGLAGSRLRGGARITPDQIFREAGDDRDEALRLLYRHGYLMKDPAPVLATMPTTATGGLAPTFAVTLRPALAGARSIRKVEQVFTREARRLTGRDIPVSFRNHDLDIAADHAEGVLRALEQFPDVDLSVRTALVIGHENAFGLTLTGSREVVFNPRYSSDSTRYRESLRRAGAARFHLRGETTPVGTGAHEVAHMVHHQYDAVALRRSVSRLIEDQADALGMDIAAYVKQELGDYALKHIDEMIAAAVADALTSGAAASQLSQGVLRLMKDQYARGRAVTSAAVSLPKEALDLSKLTVPQLRAIAKAREIAVPAGARKADIVRLLEQPDAPQIPRVTDGAIAGDYQLLGNGLNEALRAGLVPGRFDRLLRELDEQFAAAPSISAPVTVLRGVGGRAGADRIFGSSPRVGQVFEDPGFMSTTVDAASTQAYGSVEALVRMRLVPGSKALDLTPGTDFGGAVRGEILVQRGSRMRLTADSVDATGRRVIEVDVLPPARVGDDALAQAPISRSERRWPSDISGTRKDQMSDALGWYSGPEHDRINAALRRGRLGDLDTRNAETVRGLDAAMDASPLRADVAVFRAAHGRDVFGDDWTDADLTGKEWTEKAFVSTTSERASADAFTVNRGGDDGVILRIVAPEGTGGVQISGATYGEAEMLLQRGLRLRVARDRGLVEARHPATGATTRARLLDVEVVPVRTPATATRTASVALTDRQIVTAARAEIRRLEADRAIPDRLVLMEREQRRLDGAEARIRAARRGPDQGLHRAQAAEPVAQSLAALDEMTLAQGSARAIEHRLRSMGLGMRPELVDELVAAAASGDRARVAALIARIEREQGIRRTTGPAGSVEPFDPAKHQMAGGGAQPPLGSPVYVFRPGYVLDGADPRDLFRASVSSDVPATAVAPAAVTSTRTAIARQAAIDKARVVGDLGADVLEQIENGMGAAALRTRITQTAARLGTPDKVRDALLAAVDDSAALRQAVAAALRTSKIDIVAGDAGTLVRFDRRTMQAIDGTIPDDAAVLIVKPGLSFLRGKERIQISKATVEVATPEEVLEIERRATRAAARVRNRELEQAEGTGRLLAEIDELIAKKADASVIRERLQDALIAPGGPFANADPAALTVLREALIGDDLTRLKAAVTRLTGRALPSKAKLKAISRAGAKVKFDPNTMDTLPGAPEIKAGAPVTVVTRGTSVTLPDGTVVQLRKAVVTPTAKPVAAVTPQRPEIKDLARVAGVDDAELEEITSIIRAYARRSPSPPPLFLSDQDVNEFIDLGATKAESAAVRRFALRHRLLYNRIAQDHSIDATFAASWRSELDGATSLAGARKLTADQLREAIKDAPIIIRRRTEDRLRQALEDGRLKTQFETGTSGGHLDTALRSDFEELSFGYRADLSPELRPVYGHFSPGGIDSIQVDQRALNQYGEIQLVLKPEVRRRTTVTLGDSLDSREAVRPSPADRVDWRAAGPFWHGHSYIEAQIHGGVSWRDVAEVVFPRQPEPATVVALARRGVRWRVLRGRR